MPRSTIWSHVITCSALNSMIVSWLPEPGYEGFEITCPTSKSTPTLRRLPRRHLKAAPDSGIAAVASYSDYRTLYRRQWPTSPPPPRPLPTLEAPKQWTLKKNSRHKTIHTAFSTTTTYLHKYQTLMQLHILFRIAISAPNPVKRLKKAK